MKQKIMVVASVAIFIGLISAVFIAFGNSSVEAREGPKNFVVALQGTATGVETSPGVFCFDVDLVDLSTGRVIGSGTDCLDTNTITDIGDDGGFGVNNTTAFHLPGGTVVSMSRSTVQPVETPVTGATHITGEVDSGSNVNPAMGTGRFAGLTGSTRLSGIVDLTHFFDGDGIITFDCIFVIDLD